MKTIQIRGIVSLILLVLFSIVLVTGTGLWLAPYGKIARVTEWTFLGFDKQSLKEVHAISGLMMCIFIIIHLLLSHKLLLNEIKSLVK
jgi:thiosulfate reductase cytochrome b subunit